MALRRSSDIFSFEDRMTGMRTATFQKKFEAYRAVRDAIGPDHLGEFYETIIEAAYLSFLYPGAAALDCGANAGRHTIPMGEIVGPRGSVDAFEPSHAILVHLKPRIEKAGVAAQVLLHEVALGDRDGVTNFVIMHGALGMSGIHQRNLAPELSATVTVEETTVEIRRLDDVVSRSRKISFAKFDLEGGEYHALQGGKRIWTRDRPVIAFENGRTESAETFGYTSQDLFRLFGEINYRLCDCLGFSLDESDWTCGGQPWTQFLVPAERPDFESVLRFAIDRELRRRGLLPLLA